MTSAVKGPSLSVAIPASLVADTPHLREKTAKLGSVARACAIFGVREVILYPDDLRRDRPEDMQFCAELLSFIETPQYLRKRLFKLSPSLKFAGILPPLQIPSHDVPRSIRDCRQGDLREGVVVAQRGETLAVDVGLEHTLECRGEISVGTRITVRLSTTEKSLIGEIVDPSKISISRPDIEPNKLGLPRQQGRVSRQAFGSVMGFKNRHVPLWGSSPRSSGLPLEIPQDK